MLDALQRDLTTSYAKSRGKVIMQIGFRRSDAEGACAAATNLVANKYLGLAVWKLIESAKSAEDCAADATM